MALNIIEYQGKHYIFQNTRNETPRMFRQRTWFIVKNIDQIRDKAYLENLSHTWVNSRFLGVTYSDHIMKEMEISKSIYDDIS